MLTRSWIYALCIVFLIAGCAPKYNPANTPFAVYHPIVEDNVRKLEKGITSPGETMKLFGEPTRKNISDQGERYVYGYLGDTLFVNFDSSHTVSSFLYRPAIWTPVTGNTDYMTRKISEGKVRKIKIYDHNIHDIENWFKKANKKETTESRNRYTFDRRNGVLVVYTFANYEERVLEYNFTPK
ncbi:MAG: hypothetical protein KF862_04510 [Chitinophagaceae bacterium]|nr:hypothetical protein [Chitinophagaceae bacterium]